MAGDTFSALRAVQRAESVLDRDSFAPLSGVTADAAVVVGSGRIDGAAVLVVFTDGHARGGTIGVRESGILAGLAETAANMHARGRRPAALIIGFDTGGVRVEEGPMALAAASAAGVALARLSVQGVRMAAVISGPRGCFGAPAVMAALPERVIMTAGTHWGLTGPKLLGDIASAAPTPSAPPEHATAEARHAASATNRLRNGDAHAVVDDAAAAVRAALCNFVHAPSDAGTPSLCDRVVHSAAVTAALYARLGADPSSRQTAGAPPRRARQRDLLRYSFRGQWQPGDVVQRRGLVHAALGTLAGHPALGFIIGPEQSRGGVGLEEAAVVTDMLRQTVSRQDTSGAPILTFLFCQGHAVDTAQERFGLHRALAECLRAMVAARLLGHPIVSVLGGGTYGAAYLALAAPSHRILAMRGTSVAPMAPEVLRAFETLRGRKAAPGDAAHLAELIPDIRIVESVIRLPRVLREELMKIAGE